METIGRSCYLRARPVQPEPVSPELVLVDPELARRERARLEEKAYLQSVLDVAALRRAVETQPPPPAERVHPGQQWRAATAFAKRRLVPAALLCSLLANGLFVAHLVARQGDQATQVAVRIVTRTESVGSVGSPPPTSTPVVSEQRAQPDAKAATTHLTKRNAVERRVVSLILSAPAYKLPPNFVDPTTGLVKNNVQVVCKKRQRSFICAVRLPSDATRKALYLRYQTRKSGQGVFTWYGYRRSVKSLS
jgi:hypothetical protein